MPSTIRGSDNFDTAGGNAVKAWVNFNGTGTVAIRAAYNVSSITDNGTGDYTVNFATAMPDANFAPVGIGAGTSDPGGTDLAQRSWTRTTANYRITTVTFGGTLTDAAVVSAAVFR